MYNPNDTHYCCDCNFSAIEEEFYAGDHNVNLVCPECSSYDVEEYLD